MTYEQLSELARGNIERHLDVCGSVDSLYDEAYTLAFDALISAGVSVEVARNIASEQAQLIAQP